MENFHVSVCPFCKQGWVDIVKEVDSGVLFLCCDECEIEWKHPDFVLKGEKGTRMKYGRITVLTFEEVEQSGWAQYLIKE